MNKTIIDAVNEKIINAVSKLEGELLNAVYANTHKSNYKKSDVFLHKVLTNRFDPSPIGGFVIYSSDESDRDDVEFISTTFEFNELVAQMKTNFGKCEQSYSDYKFDYHLRPPVPPLTYTQAMADNGELPSVGMECLVKFHHQDNSYFQKGYVNGYSQDGNWLIFTDYLGNIESHNISEGVYDFKPLTPPIELIDGKAYQFDARDNGNLVHGVYDHHYKSFCCGRDYHFDLVSVTNIQLLTVKE